MSASNRRPTTNALSPDSTAMRLLLSRLVGERRGRQCCHVINWVLAAVFDIPAPPESPRGGWPDPKNIMRRPGLSEREIKARWQLATTSGELLLPDEMLTAFFPELIWPAIWEFTVLGPAKAVRRTETLLQAWAMGINTDMSDRKGGAVSDATVDNYLKGIKILCEEIAEVRKLEILGEVTELPPAFEEWRPGDTPTFRSGSALGGLPKNRDTSAPDLRLVRSARALLEEEIARCVKRADKCGLIPALRDRALLGIFLLGPRVETVQTLLVRDVIAEHVFPDVTRGPALRFRKFKNKAENELIRVRGISPQLYEWIVEYMDAAGIAGDPERSLWKTKREGTRHSGQPAATWSGQRLEAIMRPVQEPSDRRVYNPHSFRHLASTYATRVGIVWLNDHVEDFDASSSKVKGWPSSGVTFANVLLDHALHDIVDRYSDIKAEPGREMWSRIASLGLWEWLVGDRGARKGYDIARLRIVREEMRVALEAEANCHATIEQLRLRKKELQHTRTQARERTLRQIDQLEIKEILKRGMENDLIADQVAAIVDDIADEAEALSVAVRTVEQNRRSFAEAGEARIPLGDLVTDEEMADQAALAAELLEPLVVDDGEGGLIAQEPRVVRRWFSPKEFAWAVGCLSRSQLRRYLNGQSDYRWLFNDGEAGGAPKGVVKMSRNKQRINYDELPVERYPAHILVRLQWLMTQRHPAPLWSADDDIQAA
jgi:hypothetical protein